MKCYEKNKNVMKCYEIIEILVPEAQNRPVFRDTGFHNIPEALERKPIEDTS